MPNVEGKIIVKALRMSWQTDDSASASPGSAMGFEEAKEGHSPPKRIDESKSVELTKQGSNMSSDLEDVFGGADLNLGPN